MFRHETPELEATDTAYLFKRLNNYEKINRFCSKSQEYASKHEFSVVIKSEKSFQIYQQTPKFEQSRLTFW